MEINIKHPIDPIEELKKNQEQFKYNVIIVNSLYTFKKIRFVNNEDTTIVIISKLAKNRFYRKIKVLFYL